MMKSTRWIALIVSSASLFVTPCVLSDSELNPRLSMIAQAGNDAGISADLMYPLLQQSVTSLLYTDLELLGTGSHNAQAASLGLGYRHLLDTDDFILGGYANFDRSRSDHKYYYNQMNIGAEVLTNSWDLRGNLYWPVRNKEHILLYEGLTPYYPQGHKMVQWRDHVLEEAAKGFDAEAGMLIPDTNALRAYLGVYHYNFDQNEKSITGPRLRAEYRYDNNWTFTASEQWDKIWGNKVLLGARYSLGGVDNHLTGNLEERMMDYVIRSRQVATLLERSFRSLWSSPENFYYANSASSTSPGGGDGTYEHPYSDPNTAVIQAENNASSDANNATDTVYVYTGNSGSTPYALNVLNIGNRQVFTGSTNDLFYHDQLVIAGDSTTPSLFGELTVSNSSNVEMRNFNLTGIGANTSTGILVSNANNVNIHDVDIGNIVGANGADGTPLTSGFFKGVSYITSSADGSAGTSVVGINVSSSNNVTLSNLAIHDITGGNGGAGATNTAIFAGGNGGSGGGAAGLLVTNSTRLTWNNLAISAITGGNGGVGGDGTAGSSGLDASNAGNAGDGGAAYGVLYAGSSNLTWSGLTLNTITGGTGGNGGAGGAGAQGDVDNIDGTSGGAGGSGGIGGAANGFLFNSADNITGGTLSIDTVKGGNSGTGGAGGVGGDGFTDDDNGGGLGGNGGAGGNMSSGSGNAFGIQMISVSNALSSVGTKLNGDISITSVSGGNLANAGNGGAGGNGGNSANSTAGNGGNGGVGGSYGGGQAGYAFGIALNSSNVLLNDNITISNLAGGQGAAGGNAGNGGNAGTGNVNGNDGNGANGGNGGTAGGVFGLEIAASTVADNGSSTVTISSLTTGNGGKGGNGSDAGNANSGAIAGNGGNGGEGGSVEDVQLNSGSNLSLTDLELGTSSSNHTAGNGGAGGSGGNGSGGTDGNGGDGGDGGFVFAYDQASNGSGLVNLTTLGIAGNIKAGAGGIGGSSSSLGGAGADGGVAMGMNIGGSVAAVFGGVTLNAINITGGNGGNGANGSVGGNGGAATGVLAANTVATAFDGLQISGSIRAGNGGNGGNSSTNAANGGNGGAANVIQVSSGTLAISNTYTSSANVFGGTGGSGGNGTNLGGNGGTGGAANGMAVSGANNVVISSYTDNGNVTAGSGGVAGIGSLATGTGGNGGSGNSAAGILVLSANNVAIVSLTLNGNILAGSGGDGGNGSVGGNGSNGATAYGLNLAGASTVTLPGVTLNSINILGGDGGNGGIADGNGANGGDAYDINPASLSITVTDNSNVAGGNAGSGDGAGTNGTSGTAYDNY